MKREVKFYFVGNYTTQREYDEEAIAAFIEQMKREPNKRLYTYGVELSEVTKIKVIGVSK